MLDKPRTKVPPKQIKRKKKQKQKQKQKEQGSHIIFRLISCILWSVWIEGEGGELK